ncbi:CAAX prenyl protease-like protein [Nocardia tenerifensis]|uniref:CAAX prenyl protease-like protein n=1 Tax=Nocardia tenerifensis TaxID=228006 RepID=A0A318JML6_9NOCA|nr:type II CAAX endopeptidase family protein [Nocardia tenerifensis]PXX54066.1 CAAX prenyl protease-like protein [Nocardia tenerifensis]
MIARRNDFVLFLLVAFGAAWVLACGPWLDGEGLQSGLWLHTGAALMMLSPALGVLAVWRYRRLPWSSLAQNGLRLGARPRRTVWLTAVAWFAAPLYLWVAFGVSVLFGVYVFEFPSGDIVAASVLDAVTVATLGTLPFALGEEIGWRGWLMPQLTGRLGLAGAIGATGVIWALWHAPLTLLGYNYPSLGAWAALAFIGFCVPFGAVLGWLRMYTGSIWPCVVAHAAFNGSAMLFGIFDSTARASTPLLAGYGFVGWGVLTVVAVMLFVCFPVRPAAARTKTFASPVHPRPSFG